MRPAAWVPPLVLLALCSCEDSTRPLPAELDAGPADHAVASKDLSAGSLDAAHAAPDTRDCARDFGLGRLDGSRCNLSAMCSLHWPTGAACCGTSSTVPPGCCASCSLVPVWACFEGKCPCLGFPNSCVPDGWY